MNAATQLAELMSRNLRDWETLLDDYHDALSRAAVHAAGGRIDRPRQSNVYTFVTLL